jgi:hypothetical protein
MSVFIVIAIMCCPTRQLYLHREFLLQPFLYYNWIKSRTANDW